MSDLRELNNTLIRVIVGYHQSQDSLRRVIVTSYLRLPQAELHIALSELIDEISNQYPVRRSLMNLYLDAINKIKPLIDKKELLTIDEQQLIYGTLILLLGTSITLIGKNQKTLTAVTLNDTHIQLPGFINGIVTNSLCKSGQVVQTQLINPYFLTESNLREIVNKLIIDHQTNIQKKIEEKQAAEKIRVEEQERASKELQAEKEKTADLEQKILELENRLQENKTEQLTSASLFAEAKESSNVLRESNTTLIEQIELKDKQIAALQTEVTSRQETERLLQKEKQDLTSEVQVLKEEQNKTNGLLTTAKTRIGSLEKALEVACVANSERRHPPSFTGFGRFAFPFAAAVLPSRSEPPQVGIKDAEHDSDSESEHEDDLELGVNLSYSSVGLSHSGDVD